MKIIESLSPFHLFIPSHPYRRERGGKRVGRGWEGTMEGPAKNLYTLCKGNDYVIIEFYNGLSKCIGFALRFARGT